MKKIALVLLAVGLAGSTAMGGAMKVEQVAADAQWVAHLDAEMLLKSGIAQFILEEAEKKQEFIDGIGQIRQVFGFDPLKDVRGLTIYGKKLGDESAAVIADVTLDQERILPMLMGNASYREHTYGERKLHQWTDEPKPDKKNPGGPFKPGKTQYGCFYDKSTVVIGSSLDLLKGAVDVLDGKAKALAKSDTLPLLPKPAAGAFIIAAAENIKLPDDPNQPQTAVFRNITDVGLQLGEADGNMFLHVDALTKTAEKAAQLRQVVQGFVALGQMMMQEQKDIPLLGEKVVVNGADNTARVSAVVPTESVIKMIKFLVARAEQMKARKARMMGDKAAG